MVKKLVKKAELARIAGVSGAAVTKAIANSLKDAYDGFKIDLSHPATIKYIENKTGHRPQILDIPLPPELVPDFNLPKKEIDINEKNVAHVRGTEAAKEKKKKKSKEKFEKKETRTKTEHQNKEQEDKIKQIEEEIKEIRDNDPEEIYNYSEMSLRELIARFGTDTAFVDWLNALQKIEAIHEKRLKNAQTEGVLISQDIVQRGIFAPLDGLFTKLLTDGVKTMSSRVYAKIKSGADISEVSELIEDQLASFIRPVKSKMDRLVRGLG